jgi:hypothetical protein
LLKKEIGKYFCGKHDLNKFEVTTEFTNEFYILKDTKNECSTGRININLDLAIESLANYFKTKRIDNISKKIDIIRQVSLVLDNYYNKDFPCFNKPYRDSTQELIDHIKIYQDLDKPVHLIKRI